MESGYTHDRLRVEREYGLTLRFNLLTFEKSKKWAGVACELEFNTSEDDKRWPYLAINCFGGVIQSGWLWS